MGMRAWITVISLATLGLLATATAAVDKETSRLLQAKGPARTRGWVKRNAGGNGLTRQQVPPVLLRCRGGGGGGGRSCVTRGRGNHGGAQTGRGEVELATPSQKGTARAWRRVQSRRRASPTELVRGDRCIMIFVRLFALCMLTGTFSGQRGLQVASK